MPLDTILVPDPHLALLREKYRVAFAALNAIAGDSQTLTEAQMRARLAVQTCIDLGDTDTPGPCLHECLQGQPGDTCTHDFCRPFDPKGSPV